MKRMIEEIKNAKEEKRIKQLNTFKQIISGHLQNISLKDNILRAVEKEENEIYLMQLPYYPKLFPNGHNCSCHTQRCTQDTCNYINFITVAINDLLDKNVFDIKLTYTGALSGKDMHIYVQFSIF
jgi:hypothetical protein